MKIHKLMCLLALMGAMTPTLFAEKRNRSDLYTTGMSDAFQNPEDSFDELHAHNHSIDGDNLDWHAHPYHKGGTCARCNKYSAQAAIGYQEKRRRTCATCSH